MPKLKRLAEGTPSPPRPERSPLAPMPTVPGGENMASPPMPGLKNLLLQSSPTHPSPHMHSPFKQMPWLLQKFGHIWSCTRQVGPVKPALQVHFLVSGSHTPFSLQEGLHPPAGMAQVSPSQPEEHSHFPFTHLPWLEHVGSSHRSFIEQSCPPQPASHTHF